MESSINIIIEDDGKATPSVCRYNDRLIILLSCLRRTIEHCLSMFWFSIFLIFIIIWIIIRKVFGDKKSDIEKLRYCYNANLTLILRIVNIVGHAIRLMFNIHIFESPNFDQFKQKAIKVNKKETGILLKDFGDENEMKVFKEIYYYEADLRKFSLGQSTFTGILRRELLLRTLMERLRIVNDIKCHPEIQNIPIIAPICISGLQRTGSTLLFNLLAVDPNCRFPKAWECVKPSLPCTDPDPRIKEVDQLFSDLKRYLPHFILSHNFETHAPEECLLLFRNIGHDILATLTVEEDSSLIIKYLLETVDSTVLYKYHKLLLQILSYKEFPNNGHWLFKYSLHLLFLKEFLEIYPDARIIIIHRDPLIVVPSLATLMRNGAVTNYVDLINIGKQSLQMCGIVADILVENATNKAFLHIQYSDLLKNPFDTIKKIYSIYNLDYTMEFENNMKEWLDINQQHKFGRQSYSLDTYGLCKREIQLRFRTYCDQFNITQEHK